MSVEYDLKKSKESVGYLYPVLVAPSGEVIDGYHRRKVDPNWPYVVLTWVKTREDQLVARIAANACRRTVSKEERRSEIMELAACMLNRGIAKGALAREIARRTGLSEDYVRRLLPKRFKLEEFIHPPTSGRRLEEKAETIPSEVEKPKPDLGKVEVEAKPEYAEGEVEEAVEKVKKSIEEKLMDELRRWHYTGFIDLFDMCMPGVKPSLEAWRSGLVEFERLLCEFLEEKDLVVELKEWLQRARGG
jgi:hypothetical protein